MFAWIIGLGFAAWAKIALISAAIIAVTSLVVVFDQRGTAIATLKNSLAISKGNVKVMEETLAIRDVTLLEISKRLKGQDAELENLCKIMKEIDHADETDPNSDPIGSALDGLQRSGTVHEAD